MTMKKLLFITFLIITLSCEKEEILSPDKRIIGKWKLIGTGKWPNMEQPTADVYLYFYPDSTMIEYDVNLDSRTKCDYWVDSVLHIIQYGITPMPIHYMDDYTFYENKLRLDFLTYDGDHPTRIYQRIIFKNN
jgi:hypothetical protein